MKKMKMTLRIVTCQIIELYRILFVYSYILYFMYFIFVFVFILFYFILFYFFDMLSLFFFYIHVWPKICLVRMKKSYVVCKCVEFNKFGYFNLANFFNFRDYYNFVPIILYPNLQLKLK